VGPDLDRVAGAGEAFRSVFEPCVDGREPQRNYWPIVSGDGGTADIYADVADGTLDSLMISRFSPGLVLDLLVKFITIADAVVLPPDCLTLLAHEGQRHHLPEELRADATVVRTGADVERAMDGC
jgi:hypothetical protein